MLEAVGFKVGLHLSDSGGPNSRFFNISRTNQMTEEDVLPSKNMVSIQIYAVAECRITLTLNLNPNPNPNPTGINTIQMKGT